VQAFERDAEGQKTWVILTHWDAMDRLRDLLGREVVILGAVGDIRTSATGPTKVSLSRRRTASFPLIFFDKQILAESKVEAAKGEYIRARGVVAKYRNKYTGREEFQIVVTIPAQVEIEVLSPTVAPITTTPTTPAPVPVVDAPADDVAPAPIPSAPPAPELPPLPPEPGPAAPLATVPPP
jgi:hypothetical protein